MTDAILVCAQSLVVMQSYFSSSRLTRLGSGADAQYEDRGVVAGGASINGRSGFGGELNGRMMKNNAVFFEGKGGSVDYVLVATQTAPDHYRCFRQFHVKQPIALWGTRVTSGTYFVTTEDQLMGVADEPPSELRTAL